MAEDRAYIYIMTNKSFEGHNWVKIGYATNPEQRRRELSNTSLPFDYEIYATYEIPKTRHMADKTLHNLISSLNPDLRLSPNREFFEMTPEQAYQILYAIASITNSEDKLEKYVEEVVEPNADGILRFRNKTTSLIYDYVKARSNIEIVTSNNRYLRFVSPQIREAVGLIGSGKWSGIKDLIVYEIEVPKEGKPKLTLYIGPGIQDDRQKWNDFALKQSMLSTVTKDNNVNGNWKAIYRVQLSKDIRTYKTEDECAKEINEYLDKWFGSDFIKINDIFKRQ